MYCKNWIQASLIKPGGGMGVCAGDIELAVMRDESRVACNNSEGGESCSDSNDVK